MKPFVFSGFANADLFGDKAIRSHLEFTMPEVPTLEITVFDNDHRLSGDARRNERGDDTSGQHASILKDGDEVGSGGRLYAENVWHLRGDDGQTYRLVELEQPGKLPDTFTFLGDIPAAGVSLTVRGPSNVKGNGLVYEQLGAGDTSPAKPNIVEIAAGSDDFNLLVKALAAAGLVEAVQNSDDITVFAPTDAAFTQLAVDLGFDGDASDEDAVFAFIADALAGLAPDGNPIPLLADILLYHVSPGAKTADEVDAAETINTLLEDAKFGSDGAELIDNEPDVTNPTIVGPDVGASNGTIQVIDRVLIPLDIPGNTQLPNIVDIAAGSDDFTILVKALGAARLVEAVQNSEDITVFAPTDAAFGQLATDLGFQGNVHDEDAVFGFIASTLASLAPDGDPIPLLADILLYHVSPGAKSAVEIDAADRINTLLTDASFGSEGTELVDNEPDVTNPNIVGPDISASNGIVQVIDRVLIPLDIPGNEPEPTPLPTLTELVAASGGVFDNDGTDFDLLLNAVTAAGLGDALNDPAADLTVFAPDDAAFVSLAQTLGFGGSDEGEAFGYIVEALTLLSSGGDPIPLLTSVLTYHVAPEVLDSSAVLANDDIVTLQGGTLTVDGTSLVDADPDIPNPNLIATDLPASNGIAHVLDGVLIPVDILPSDGSNSVDFVIDDDSASRIRVAKDNDFVDGNGGNDKIWLGRGDDVGLGGSGNDFIRGGRGDDLINGGTGNDRMVGDHGADTFVFNLGDGHDRIHRFEDGIDLLDISGSGLGFSDLHITERANSVLIQIGDDQSIKLEGRHIDISVDDFIF